MKKYFNFCKEDYHAIILFIIVSLLIYLLFSLFQVETTSIDTMDRIQQIPF